jgi:uncharacterized membrane protein YsdA (DUF1294 family)
VPTVSSSSPSNPRPLVDRLRRQGSFFLAAAFLTAAVGAVGMGMISPWVSQAYLAMSLLTMVTYGLDKEKAERGEWRTAESLLHLLELAGGWPGALVAQQLFRHKTRKVGYQAIFWLTVLLHLGFWTWVFTDRVSGPAILKRLR